MAEKQKLTKVGKKNLEDELYNLVNVVREEVKVQLKEAREQGDLSENADYDAARGKQAEVEARIKEIEYILNNCEIIDEGAGKGTKKVSLGSTVTLLDLATNEENTYMIVGTVEADPLNGKISNDCALGLAIVGKGLDDVVEVKSNKPYQVKILKIELK